MPHLPEINDLVRITDGAGREYRSRVEGAEPASLVLARPMELPAEHDIEPGADLLVSWPDVSGVWTLPTRLLGSSRERTLALWTVEITGEPWREQRREFVRAPAYGPVLIAAAGPGESPVGSSTVEGTLLDLSEAALRCSVPAAEGSWLASGTLPVTVDFAVEDDRFELAGTVHASAPADAGQGRLEVVVQFDRPVPGEQRLRRRVFDLQRSSRRG